MRDSLKKSLADSPVSGFERYPSGSVVLCNACCSPLYVLDGAICVGDKSGRMAERFKPLTSQRLTDLAGRDDIDAGVKAMINGWDEDRRKEHLSKLKDVKAGDPMMCPICDGCFVQVVSVEAHEVLDRAYTVELVTIPPSGYIPPIRGKQLGYTKDWIH